MNNDASNNLNDEKEQRFNAAMRTDPDVLYIGEASESDEKLLTDVIDSRRAVVTHAYANLAVYRKTMLGLSGLRMAHPAMYEVCNRIIDRDENAKLPRGMDRWIARSERRRNIVCETPIEYSFG